METLTIEQIQQIETDAGRASDLLMAAACQIVRSGEPEEETLLAMNVEKFQYLVQCCQRDGKWNVDLAHDTVYNTLAVLGELP